ncbi:MAG TPA: efflux RND transporter periplasmic adaptor subunit [Nitrospira sp.]|jgi:multidrug efflux pump subunit AcrA (membrane-fusion protein)|nr:efflux RND transporter periplasmic adaptor subunit [Nitrospira sp.]
MKILNRFSVWLAVGGVTLAVWTVLTAGKQTPMPTPLVEPPRSQYDRTVAATGIIEAVNENVRIGPPAAGLVTKVFVAVGDRVGEGDPLLQLDDRDLRAQLVARQAAIPPAQAQVEEQRYRIGDLDTQLKRLQAVRDSRAVSEDDVKRTWYASEMAKRALSRFEATLKQVIAQRDETQILLDRLTVRSPRVGTVLQVNVRAGEYALTTGAIEPLMLLGDMQQLQVRAEVDEVNAPLVIPQAPGIAYLKGNTTHAIPLSFVRVEPYIVPKKSLTGDNSERVDTRVLQIIYRFERPPFPVYAGQQVDVFIDRTSAPSPSQTPRGTRPVGEQPQ